MCKALGALSHSLALEIQIFFSTELECSEALNDTPLSCLSQYYCCRLVNMTVCSLSPLPELISSLSADGE